MTEPPFIQICGMARKITFPTSPPPQTPSPYCCLPSLVLRVSRFEYSTSSSHVRGGLSGSSPASRYAPRL